MDYLGKTLEGFEFKTLFFVLKKIDYQNSLIIDSTFRKNLSILFGNKSPSVIARAIKGLIEKQILIEINTPELRERFQSFVGNAYYVNPNIIGKGSFRDIKKLRQTTIVDYDFEQNQVKKRVNVDTEYKEAQDVLENSADYQIDNVELIENEKDKIKGTNLIISKKDEKDAIKEMEHKPDIAIALAQIELEEAQLKLKKATLLQQNSEIAQVNTGGGGIVPTQSFANNAKIKSNSFKQKLIPTSTTKQKISKFILKKKRLAILTPQKAKCQYCKKTKDKIP
ncbi:hypothetical protein SIN57_001152 [Campylobacter upsaliensis]|nr:hypothetical protein [Campylobacter upsaliensis]